MSYRKLPVVTERVKAPSRLSQTLLGHANICPRSAFLALKYRDQPATLEMDRGTAFHLFMERMIRELVVRGAVSLYAPGVGEDAMAAAGEVASMTKVMVEEVLADRRELVLPHYEREHLREMAYHAAVAFDVDPTTVAGVERLFVLDLDNGWTVSGKIDLLSLPDDFSALITDWKTSLAVADQETFENRFQVKLYALLVMFGQPVDVRECCVPPGAVSDCELCDGKGYIETRLPSIGAHIREATGREVHPRPRPRIHPDGRWEMVNRSHTWTRQEIADFRHDVEWVTDVIEHGLKTGDWPARYDKSHCGICPAEMECPLPRHLRRFAGAIDSHEKAAEAWTWAERTAARVKFTKAEVRAFLENHGGPLVLENERVLDFETSFRRSVKRSGRNSDWEGLLAALEERVKYGSEFDFERWVPERPSTSLKERDAAPGELQQKEDGDV